MKDAGFPTPAVLTSHTSGPPAYTEVSCSWPKGSSCRQAVSSITAGIPTAGPAGRVQPQPRVGLSQEAPHSQGTGSGAHSPQGSSGRPSWGQWGLDRAVCLPQTPENERCGCSPGPGAEQPALTGWLSRAGARARGGVLGGQAAEPRWVPLCAQSSCPRPQLPGPSPSCSTGPSQVDEGRRAPVTHTGTRINLDFKRK